MSAVQVAMIAGLPYTALRDAVLTHPTLVEGLISAVLIGAVGTQCRGCNFNDRCVRSFYLAFRTKKRIYGTVMAARPVLHRREQLADFWCPNRYPRDCCTLSRCGGGCACVSAETGSPIARTSS